MSSSPVKEAKKAEKFPSNADYGTLEMDDRTYEFMRVRGGFCLRFTNTEGTKLKILLKNVPGENNSYRWLPTDIYYVRGDGNRRVYNFGRFYNNLFLDATTSNRLTGALRNYRPM